MRFIAYANIECYREMLAVEEMRAQSTEAGFSIVDRRRSIEYGGASKDRVLVCNAQKPE